MSEDDCYACTVGAGHLCMCGHKLNEHDMADEGPEPCDEDECGCPDWRPVSTSREQVEAKPPLMSQEAYETAFAPMTARIRTLEASLARARLIPPLQESHPALMARAWHDVTCPEGPDCRDRLLHSMAQTIANTGHLGMFLERLAQLHVEDAL